MDTQLSSKWEIVCRCEGNYYGVACEQCAPGWGGDTCDTPMTLRVRRNVESLNEDEKATVVKAFQLMRTMPHPWWPSLSVWQWTTSLHAWARAPISNNGTPILCSCTHC
jgi:hypothetical protein